MTGFPMTKLRIKRKMMRTTKMRPGLSFRSRGQENRKEAMQKLKKRRSDLIFG